MSRLASQTQSPLLKTFWRRFCLVVLRNFAVAHFRGNTDGVSGGGVPPLKMSGIGHLWFLGLCRNILHIKWLLLQLILLKFEGGYRQAPTMTTPVRYDTADYQFLISVPDDVI